MDSKNIASVFEDYIDLIPKSMYDGKLLKLKYDTNTLQLDVTAAFTDIVSTDAHKTFEQNNYVLKMDMPIVYKMHLINI